MFPEMQDPGTAIRITTIKAARLRALDSQCLIRVETDAGLIGYGEAGASAEKVRAHLEDIRPWILGQNALEIDRLFTQATSQMHPSRAHIPTISGLDIALWDLAGRALGRPISSLLTGRLRETIPVYATCSPVGDLADRTVWREFASTLPERFPGWKTIKLGFDTIAGVGSSNERQIALPSQMLTATELTRIGRCFELARDALGDTTEFIVHCHNEWDLPTALGLAQAIAPAAPLWLEDPMPVHYSSSWRELGHRSPVRVVTGEKLELAREFLPFITSGAVQGIHPDLVFSGGMSGCRRIADLADLYQIPVVTHCVGSVVQMAATAHFGSTVRNFVMSETRLAHDDHPVQQIASEQLPMRDGFLTVPQGPGLGIDLTTEHLRDLVGTEGQWA